MGKHWVGKLVLLAAALALLGCQMTVWPYTLSVDALYYPTGAPMTGTSTATITPSSTPTRTPTPSPTPRLPTATPVTACVVRTGASGGRLNFRSEPGGYAFGYLLEGDRVIVLEFGDGWNLVVDDDLRTGWVFARFLRCGQ